MRKIDEFSLLEMFFMNENRKSENNSELKKLSDNYCEGTQ